jgi:hypothetical protein
VLIANRGEIAVTDRVEALGGRLSLHSPPGAGTTLLVALPLTAVPSAEVTSRQEDTGRDLAVEPEPSGPCPAADGVVPDNGHAVLNGRSR